MVAADVGSDTDRVGALIEEHGIHTVECMFADTWGIPRGKRLPAKQFLKSPGFAIANVAYTWDMHSFIFPTGFVNEAHGYPDMHAAADLSTFLVGLEIDRVADAERRSLAPAGHAGP